MCVYVRNYCLPGIFVLCVKYFRVVCKIHMIMNAAFLSQDQPPIRPRHLFELSIIAKVCHGRSGYSPPCYSLLLPLSIFVVQDNLYRCSAFVFLVLLPSCEFFIVLSK